jgi:GNAT superfamily N-acetyltransferase
VTAVDDAAQVRVRMDAVRAGARTFGTNFFLGDGAVERACKDQALFFREFPGALLLLKREAGFDRLFYAAAEPEALAAAVPRFAPAPERPLVADVIGRPADAGMWVEPLTAAGLERYESFQRMQRVVSAAPDQAALKRVRTISRMLNPKLRDAPIQIAGETDAAEIVHALNSQFDPLSEHLPEVDEVAQAAASGAVLTIRDGGALAALLYYDRSGLTTTCRYWLAMPGYLGLGYAELLMERYFQVCAACRRFLLWVRQGNRAAIPLYRAYGYTEDSMVDVILLRR